VERQSYEFRGDFLKCKLLSFVYVREKGKVKAHQLIHCAPLFFFSVFFVVVFFVMGAAAL